MPVYLSSSLHMSSLPYKHISSTCFAANMQIQCRLCFMVSQCSLRDFTKQWVNSFPSHNGFHIWEDHPQPRAQTALQYCHLLCCSLCHQQSIQMLGRSHHFAALQFTEYQTLFLPAHLNHSFLPWLSPASITASPSYLASKSHKLPYFPGCSNHSF